MRILLVEDEQMLGEGVKTALKKKGYVVDWVKDGEKALAALKAEQFECVVLDIGLPKRSGLHVLAEAREAGVKVPVLILTARDSVEDRVKGLDVGADDYLPKPFELTELFARVRALIRRSTGRAEAKLIYGDIVLTPAAHTVTVKGELVTLQRREYALLQKLLENQGKVLSRDQLMQSIYGWSGDIDSNALEVHIHNIRKKISPTLIQTIRGIGYMIEKEEKA